MLDQLSLPYRESDAAYLRPSPGGYAIGQAPADPAYKAEDSARLVPRLGGYFQVGSGTPAAIESPVPDGADADGGAAAIANAPRIGAPPPYVPPAQPELALLQIGMAPHAVPMEPEATPSGIQEKAALVVFSGQASVDTNVMVAWRVNSVPVKLTLSVLLPAGTSAGMAAAILATALSERLAFAATSSSNVTRIGTKTPNRLDTFSAFLSAATQDGAAEEDAAEEVAEEEPEPPAEPDTPRKRGFFRKR